MEKIALKACNGKFVCAEGKGEKALIANRDKAANWETFEWVKKGKKTGLKAKCNGKHVCAEGAGKKALIANRANFDAWETFEVIPLDVKGLSDLEKKAKDASKQGKEQTKQGTKMAQSATKQSQNTDKLNTPDNFNFDQDF